MLRGALIGIALSGLAVVPLAAGATSGAHATAARAVSVDSARFVSRLRLRREKCHRQRNGPSHRHCNRRRNRHGSPHDTSAAPPNTTASPTAKDTAAPKFAGLQRAFACTPGPQRPGQTTPFTLGWEAATDDVTPPSRIVYDVYLATTSGGEDFSEPTWTTPPGVSSYRTPGLPSHGTFYFVVRARDLAGNEDGNTVELRGSDPCL